MSATMENVIRKRATPDPDHPEQRIMRLAFTGYRPQKMPFGFDEADTRCIDFKKRLRDTIENFIWQGYRHFISGGAMGMDMYAAEIVQELKVKYPGIILEMVRQEGITEALKAANQMEWVRRMNAITHTAEEFILAELIFI